MIPAMPVNRNTAAIKNAVTKNGAEDSEYRRRKRRSHSDESKSKISKIYTATEDAASTPHLAQQVFHEKHSEKSPQEKHVNTLSKLTYAQKSCPAAT